MFYFPAPRCGGSRLPLLVVPAPGLLPQLHRLPSLPAPPPGIGGGGCVGGSGERGMRLGVGLGMRASDHHHDIGGIGWPAVTPGPGPSLLQRWLPLLPPPPPWIGSGACIMIGGSWERGRRWGGRGDERCYTGTALGKLHQNNYT